MSDLDDAIREHLALKRQHGADPLEVARLESEALGEASRMNAPEPAQPRTPFARFAEYAQADAGDASYGDRPLAATDYDAAEPPHEEPIAPPTNEYAPAYASATGELSEATQEYSVDESIGWLGGTAWQGGAA